MQFMLQTGFSWLHTPVYSVVRAHTGFLPGGPEVGLGTRTPAPERASLHIKLTASFAQDILAFGGQPVDSEGVNKALTCVIRVWTVMYSSTGCFQEGLFYWLVV